MATDALVHPGELIADELEERKMTQRDLAEAMGRPAYMVNGIVRGRRRVTAAVALDLERVWATPAEVWMNLQAKYDLAVARRNVAG